MPPNAPERTDRVEAEPRAVNLLGPDTLTWDIAGDRRFGLMYGSAFVLQTMHPQIAAAVSTLSTFRADPWGRQRRSLISVQKWVYGGPAALREGDRLVAMHRGMRGSDARGVRYDALDPDPWTWVPLTGLYSTIVGARYFYDRPFTEAEELRLFDESIRVCRVLNVPEHTLPRDLAGYHAYFERMVEQVLEDHPIVHDLLDLASRAPAPETFVPRLLWPIARKLGAAGLRLAMVGLLPPAAREKLRVSFTATDERELRVLGRAFARAFPRLPERLRYLPIAYHARRAARAQHGLERALAG